MKLSPSGDQPDGDSLREVLQMSQIDSVAVATKTFASYEEDDILASMKGKQLIGWLDSGSKFYGTLEAFTEHRLFIVGNRGQRIIIKKRKVSRLEAV